VPRPFGVGCPLEPGAGERVDKGETITVVTSSGPAPVELGSFEGLSLADAQRVLGEQHISYDDAENLELYSDAPDDQVIDLDIIPAGTEERVPCFEGCAAHQGDTADFVVSLGPLPDVTGRPIGEAQKTLEDAGLTVTVAEEYSDGVLHVTTR
jgi:serine/threonine-protein kinase